MPLVDSHCHLDFPEFADDLAALVDRAHAAGVGTMLTISTHLSRFDRVAALALRFASVYCTVGVHPHEAATEEPITVERLLALAARPKVVGFGETGLDYYYEHSPRAHQQAAFDIHLEAAAQARLPLVVHTRDADADTVPFLERAAARGVEGVLHCFSSTRELAETAVRCGFYISFSGVLTFKKADELRRTAAHLPLDRLLVETDAPFLAPAPHRGRRNEPAYVVHTAAVLAQAQGVSVEEIARATTENFFRLFAAARPTCG